MPHDSKFVDRVLALLTPNGDVRARPMFGGHGVYLDGMMFALIARDRLYFKTDAETRPRFVRTGSKPFGFMRGSREMVTSYYEAPPRTMNSARAIMPWVELATIAARGAAKAKRTGAKKPVPRKAAAKKAKPPAKTKQPSAKTGVGKAKAARRTTKRVVKSKP
ncbi:MAG TPA: TfoX/Sxy family protein [Alphaproteobacteria bacterium]|jgi:DNA transformation protein